MPVLTLKTDTLRLHICLKRKCYCACRLAAEKAAKTAAGPASLRTGLLDSLFNLSADEVRSGVRLQVRELQRASAQ